MEKINLSEFKENSLAINEMLHTSGGSSDSSGTVHCQTQCNGSDADHKTCDVEWQLVQWDSERLAEGHI